MDNKEQEQFSNKKNQSLKSFSNVAICSIACLLLVISVLLTFMLTSAADRSYYQKKLDEQQAVINQMESLNKVEPTLSGSSFEKLDVLSQIFDQYSYYVGQKTEEEMMRVRNLGKKSLKEVKDKLAELGLGFKSFD